MRARRILIFTAIALLVVIADQWTKVLVRADLGAPLVYGSGLLTLVHTENSGAFLSFGADLPGWIRTLIFGGFVSVMLVMFTIAVLRGSIMRLFDTVAAAAIIGGGLGNLIDRVLRSGRVTDFLYLEAGPLHTGVFNVADMAITCGVLWLLASSFRKQPVTPSRADGEE